MATNPALSSSATPSPAPAGTREAILETRGIVKRFPGVVALKNVSFDLRAGEIHALCGENGAGKSTLIKLLSGLWPHGSYEGELLVRGKTAEFATSADAQAAGIAVITQELALIDEMTVAENIFLGQAPQRGLWVDWETMEVRAAQYLKQFQVDMDPQALIGTMGVGHKQMVEIVKALSRNSAILILDEPTAALTDRETEALLKRLKDLRDRGLACIYISHRLEEVFAISDRITILRDGSTITTLNTRETDRHEVIRHMVGRELGDLFPRRASHPGKPLLSVRNLSAAPVRGASAFLHDISLEVRAGEVLGIGGLMGAGRTELLMHIFGAWGDRLSGEVELCGKSLPPAPVGNPGASLKAGLVLVSEDRRRYGVILEQPIGFNLSLASLDKFSRRPIPLLDQDREVVECSDYFKRLRVKANSLETIIGGLSGGNQQKVVLGKALMTNPKVVFLDEPTRGIDVGAKLEVYEFVNTLTDAGMAVVLVSSELPELMGMSDRIIMLNNGHVGGEFSRE
ncbi:MAG TPA: sugar ABC transporter ATP-binding protein, partial [Candidatus Methylacidiphilales bacterium]|nr:sugar ABC transporter ATP-binding protein [Candidatus Methylacidiphilales bacterium]